MLEVHCQVEMMEIFISQTKQIFIVLYTKRGEGRTWAMAISRGLEVGTDVVHLLQVIPDKVRHGADILDQLAGLCGAQVQVASEQLAVEDAPSAECVSARTAFGGRRG